MQVPAFLRSFADDAAIFPPAHTPLERAVAEHRTHRAADYAELVGPFLVSDTRLPDLARLVEAEDPETHEDAGAAEAAGPLRVQVVITGGAGAIEPAVTWARRATGLDLVGVEFALRDEADLAHNARRLVSVLDALADQGLADDDLDVYAEVPAVLGGAPSHGWLAALDELAMRELPLKLRTGGADAGAFPSSTDLAVCLDAALDRELPVKCTAGLHHAVRHTGAETGLPHHGFLNLLLATRATLDGEGTEAVVAVLEETDRDVVAAAVAEDPDAMARTRRWFRSFGTCAVLEAHEDLVDLGLLETG